MRESAKKHLRQNVLELRSELRGYLKELDTVKREKTCIENSITQVANEIREIQEDCGDSIQIDPQHPEIV